MLLTEMISKNHVSFCDSFDSWEEAIQASCEKLLADNTIEQPYVDSIVSSVKEFGPYIVFAPNVAMPHSQKNAEGVNGTAISFMRVKSPVCFSENDRDKDASLFFTVCATDSDLHLSNMEKLSELLVSSPTIIEDLMAAESEADLIRIEEELKRG